MPETPLAGGSAAPTVGVVVVAAAVVAAIVAVVPVAVAVAVVVVAVVVGASRGAAEDLGLPHGLGAAGAAEGPAQRDVVVQEPVAVAGDVDADLGVLKLPSIEPVLGQVFDVRAALGGRGAAEVQALVAAVAVVQKRTKHIINICWV